VTTARSGQTGQWRRVQCNVRRARAELTASLYRTTSTTAFDSVKTPSNSISINYDNSTGRRRLQFT